MRWLPQSAHMILNIERIGLAEIFTPMLCRKISGKPYCIYQLKSNKHLFALAWCVGKGVKAIYVCKVTFTMTA